MSYIYYIFKVLLLTAGIYFLWISSANSQTCCSGGVPLSGNIGFKGADRGAFQIELSYDLNYLITLKDGSDVYTNENRRRVTQSVLLKAGYSITKWMALDAMFSYVNQSRRITYMEAVNDVSTNGIGDAVLITKFILSRFSETGTEMQLGAGPKIPFGRSDMTNDRGITLNADLQPGSGSWDIITWGYFIRQTNFRPSTTISARIVGRMNGSNREYLGNQIYRFGNSIQLYLGMGDRFLAGGRILSTSLSVRFRKAQSDMINGILLDNTGGQWMSIIPSIGWSFGQNSLIQLIPEIPIVSRVEGIQLTPTFRIQAGIYHNFGRKNKSESNTYQL
ncbi:MAG: hypothetical protein ABFS38_19380 [Bacteroidota bacterium]